MKEKSFHIDNFIATYDNYILDSECNRAIQLFEEQQKFNNTITRSAQEKADGLTKKDSQFYAAAGNIEVWHSDLKVLIANFDMALKHYEKVTDIKTSYGGRDFLYTTLKIQKTLPGEGYHVWHVEKNAGFNYNNRVIAFSIYLNDIEEGGETEFLHQSLRVKPKKGRIAIWPANFPYVHRGNPPLSGEKYILTSWLLLPYD